MNMVGFTISKLTYDPRHLIGLDNAKSRGWYYTRQGMVAYGESVDEKGIPEHRMFGIVPTYVPAIAVMSTEPYPSLLREEASRISEVVSPRIFDLLDRSLTLGFPTESVKLGRENEIHQIHYSDSGQVEVCDIDEHKPISVIRSDKSISLLFPEGEPMILFERMIIPAFKAWENQFFMCGIPSVDRRTSPGVLGPKLERCTYVASDFSAEILKDSFIKENYKISVVEPIFSKKHGQGKEAHSFIICQSRLSGKTYVIDPTYMQFTAREFHDELPVIMIFEINNKEQATKELEKHKIPPELHKFWLSQI